MTSETNIQVLVVEDEPHALAFMKRQFEREGWTCKEVKSVKEAEYILGLSIDETGIGGSGLYSPTVITLDVHMPPDKDGIEFLCELRRHDHTRDIPVVLITIKAGDNHIKLQANKHNATLLPKPFVADELITAVRSAFVS